MSTRVVFMGTPDFSVPTLNALIALGWDVLVVTQPDRKVGRKQLLTPSPVKQRALELGLRVFQPEKIRDLDAVETLQAFRPDLLVTAAYGQILPKSVLALPAHGKVNVHASLLPRWRGAAPIHRAIMAGDEKTGVTLMEMVSALDAGPIIEMREIPIGQMETTGDLHDKLAILGAEMCSDILPQYIVGDVRAKPQSEEGVTYATRLERKDEFVNWTLPAPHVSRTIRGLSPWPGASAVIGDGQTLKVWSDGLTVAAGKDVNAGLVVKRDQQVVVGCGDDAIVIDSVQPAGKRKMAARDWFTGLHVDAIQFQRGGMV